MFYLVPWLGWTEPSLQKMLGYHAGQRSLVENLHHPSWFSHVVFCAKQVYTHLLWWHSGSLLGNPLILSTLARNIIIYIISDILCHDYCW